MPHTLGEPLFARTFPAEAAAVRSLRDAITTVALECGISGTGIDDVRIAVTEIATNAVVHAYGHGGAPQSGEIRVEMFQEHGELVVVIADDGVGVAPRIESPGLGLGLPVVASLTERLELRSGAGGGTEVHLAFACDGRA